MTYTHPPGTKLQKYQMHPLQKYLRRHAGRPQVYTIVYAFNTGERRVLSSLTKRIKSDDWGRYLARIGPYDLPATRKYIEREDM